jgi:uncharacterized protein with PIN domain
MPMSGKELRCGPAQGQPGTNSGSSQPGFQLRLDVPGTLRAPHIVGCISAGSVCPSLEPATESRSAESAMKEASVRFYAGLNDFLPPERKGRPIVHTFFVSGSVKDLIETLGVPHTEIELILVNGEPVNFSYRVQDNDRISVYPRFYSLDVSPLSPVPRHPAPPLRFVADTHLGRLSAYLRMLGFDTLYDRASTDKELAVISADEERLLLTRDRGLLMRNRVRRGYFVRETAPRRQLVEVLQHFDLISFMAPFRRCIHCNACLRPVRKEAIAHRLLPETKQYYEEFFVCPCCGRVYWKGSHYRRMRHFIDEITAHK